MKKNKILIIDGERLLATAYSDHLERKGYETQVAFSGQEGLLRMKTFVPDLILLDIALPKPDDGLLLIKKIKKNPRTKNVPIIVLTNTEERESKVQAMRLGITYYMEKFNYTLKDLSRQTNALLKQ